MSIAKHTSYNLFGSVIPVAVSLVTVPLYLGVVGLERYGILALCWTLLGYMGFLNLGLGPAVAQRIAVLRKADSSERAEVFWTALWSSIGMGLVAGALVYVLAGLYFAQIDDLPVSLSREISDGKVWLSAIIPTVLLSGVFTGALKGQERFLTLNVITSSTSVAMSLAPLAVAYLVGPDLFGLLAASLLARFASLIALFFASRAAVPARKIMGVKLGLLKKLLSFGGWVTASSIFAPLLVTFDRFVIGALAGAAAVSNYVVPYNLVYPVQMLPSALQSALEPRFAYLEKDLGETLHIEIVALLNLVFAPIIISAMAVVGPFLILWIGADLAQHSQPVAYILLAGWWINSYARVPYSLLVARGRPDLIAKVLALYLIPYGALLYYSVSAWGVVGAAMAWSLRSTLDPLCFFTLTGHLRKLPSLLLPSAIAVSMALVTVFLVPVHHWERYAILSALALSAFGYSFWNLPQPLRERLGRLVHRAVSAGRAYSARGRHG